MSKPRGQEELLDQAKTCQYFQQKESVENNILPYNYYTVILPLSTDI